ncbi:hypothetical protein DP44_6492 [Burkholderia pseudomallei]|nr:hypothetical protein DP44_6492 [Burkholderia pseudomallei]
MFGGDSGPGGHAALDREIEIAAAEFAPDVGNRHAAAHEPHAGRFARERLDELRQRDRFEHVAHADDEAHVERAGAEAGLRARRILQPLQMALDVGDHLARALGRHDLVALSHEERIAEMRAQPVQRMGDGRLRQMQRAGGGADAALHVDRVEYAEQVQVESVVGLHRRFGVPAFGVWRLAFGVWRLAFGVWRLAFGVWRFDAPKFRSSDAPTHRRIAGLPDCRIARSARLARARQPINGIYALA